jgi:uncharacterized membrane protein
MICKNKTFWPQIGSYLIAKLNLEIIIGHIVIIMIKVAYMV